MIDRNDAMGRWMVAYLDAWFDPPNPAAITIRVRHHRHVVSTPGEARRHRVDVVLHPAAVWVEKVAHHRNAEA